jgi:hypothetical protein
MMAWQLVAHSFVLLFRNLGDALKVSIGPIVIGLGMILMIFGALGAPMAALMQADDPETMQQAGSAALVAVLLAMVILALVSSWVAVSWHRFVLLEEYPGLIPSLSRRPILPYLGRIIQLTLVLILVGLPLGFVAGLVTVPFMAGGPTPAALTIGLISAVIVGAILSWFWLRLGLVLPGCAVGRPMGIGDSWNNTARVASPLMAATLILMVINIVATGIIDLVFGVSLLASILNAVVSWVSVMVGISMLTTLYGHLIEGRELAP